MGKLNCRHSDSSSSPSLILWEDPRTRGLLRVTSRSACLFPREMWFIDHEYTQDFIEVAKIIDTPVLTHYSILGKHNSSKVRMCTHFNAPVYPVHPRCQGHNKSLVTHTHSLNSAHIKTSTQYTTPLQCPATNTTTNMSAHSQCQGHNGLLATNQVLLHLHCQHRHTPLYNSSRIIQIPKHLLNVLPQTLQPQFCGSHGKTEWIQRRF